MSAATSNDLEPGMVEVQEAQARLSELLRKVEDGAEFTISRGGRPIARLVPVESRPRTVRRRKLAFLNYQVPETFFEDLPEEELAAWERGS